MADIAPVPVTVTTTTTAKPGYATTEFWLKLAAIALTALFASGVIPTAGTAATVAAIAATMLGALGYTVSRTWAKSAAGILLLLGLGGMASQMACGSTAKSVEVTAGHAVVDCAETEARAQAVNVMTPVVQAVIQGSTSADGKLIDTAPIKSALGKLTKDTLYTEAWIILSCAAKTAFAALTYPAPARSASVAALSVIDPTAIAKAEADVMAAIAPGVQFQLGRGPTSMLDHTDPDLLARDLMFCNSDCSVDRTCSEGTSCNKCVGGRCTTAVPVQPEPMIATLSPGLSDHP